MSDSKQSAWTGYITAMVILKLLSAHCGRPLPGSWVRADNNPGRGGHSVTATMPVSG